MTINVCAWPMLSKKALRLAPNSDFADSEGQGLGGSDDGSAEGRSGEFFYEFRLDAPSKCRHRQPDFGRSNSRQYLNYTRLHCFQGGLQHSRLT